MRLSIKIIVPPHEGRKGNLSFTLRFNLLSCCVKLSLFEESIKMATLNINGTNIYYEVHGNTSAPALIFLHGLGSSAQDWEKQLEAFTPDYHVVLIDMRGHGQSDKPRSTYSISGFASDVIAVMDHLNIPQAHIVGLSMGGMIAFQLAVDHPTRLTSMVIVNSAPAVVPRTFKDRMGVWMRFLIVRVMGMQKMGETLAPRLFPDADLEFERQSFIQRWAQNDQSAYLNAMNAIVGWSVEERIGSISIPTLILTAAQDYTPVASKEEYIAKMKAAPVSLKVIDNAHHALSVERPAAFNAAVKEFLASV